MIMIVCNAHINMTLKCYHVIVRFALTSQLRSKNISSVTVHLDIFLLVVSD